MALRSLSALSRPIRCEIQARYKQRTQTRYSGGFLDRLLIQEAYGRGNLNLYYQSAEDGLRDLAFEPDT